MRITDEIVEAAARDAFLSDAINGHHKGGIYTWESIPEIGRENYREMTRMMLDTAAPLILRAAADVLDNDPDYPMGSSAQTAAADWLRTYAEQKEQ